MKRTWIAAVVIGLVGSATGAVTAHAENIGEEGCTPGYWKNHTDNWFEDEGVAIPTTWLLSSPKVGFVTTSALAGDTLLDALGYKGGSGAAGAERILMRAAASAWLNAAHEGLGYPYRRYGGVYPIVPTVNAAIASGDRATMLEVAATLDAANNLGCPLN